MNEHPRETDVPPNSLVAVLLAGSNFHDAWCIDSSATEVCALGHFMSAVERTPRWVEACMALRNRVAGLVGLKNLGHLSALPPGKPAAAFRPGDRVGIFTVMENSFDEALLGERDKHLNVVVSVHRAALPAGNRVRVTVTTVVHIHNALGHLYMLPVRPMHRLIAPRVLRGIGAAGSSA